MTSPKRFHRYECFRVYELSYFPSPTNNAFCHRVRQVGRSCVLWPYEHRGTTTRAMEGSEFCRSWSNRNNFEIRNIQNNRYYIHRSRAWCSFDWNCSNTNVGWFELVFFFFRFIVTYASGRPRARSTETYKKNEYSKTFSAFVIIDKGKMLFSICSADV